MNIVFFGNTKYSAIGLEIIHGKFPVCLVVTTPDKPSGRKRELKPSPTKQFAKQNKIPILEAEKLDEKALEEIRKLEPDFLIVEDYGLILPESILEIPKYAPLNIHHSLLPKYRGSSPAPSAILAGEKESGVTIIEMTNRVDAGDILGQVKYTLSKDETTDSLLTTLNKMGAELIIEVLPLYLTHPEHSRSVLGSNAAHSGSEHENAKFFIPPMPQDDKQANYTQRLNKQDGYFDITNPPGPEKLDRMIRAYYPWPGVWTELRIKNEELRIKLLPPTVLLRQLADHNPTDPFAIQPEGKRPMNMKEFLNGYPQTREALEKLKA